MWWLKNFPILSFGGKFVRFEWLNSHKCRICVRFCDHKIVNSLRDWLCCITSHSNFLFPKNETLIMKCVTLIPILSKPLTCKSVLTLERENIKISMAASGHIMLYERWADSREEWRPPSHHLVTQTGRQTTRRLSTRLISIPLAHWVIGISNWVL